jgi:aspartate ammonia-lyase
MVCFQVSGNDHAIALAAGAGELELNVMTPLVATNLAESLELLTRATRLLRTRCIAGLRVDRARVRDVLARSHAEATALSPYLGYDVTAEVVKQAQARSATIRDVVLAHGLMAPAALARLLGPRALTGPRATDRALRRRVQASPAYQAFRATFLR